MPTRKVNKKLTGTTEVKQTSLNLPVDLWRRAKLRALEDGTDFRTVVIEAMERHLKKR